MRKIIVSLMLFFSLLLVAGVSLANDASTPVRTPMTLEEARHFLNAGALDQKSLWLKSRRSEWELLEITMRGDFDTIDWNAIFKDVYGYDPRNPPKGPTKPGTGDGNDSGIPGFLDVTYILENLQKQIPALTRLVVAISYVCGLVFIILAVGRLKAYGHQTVASAYHTSMGPSLAYGLAGAALMYFPSMMNVGTATLLGPVGGDSLLGYSPLNGLPYAQLFVTVIMIVRLVGFIAFLRGWLMLSKVGSSHGQQGQLTKGIVHLIGGILAVNIITTWEILRATLGYVW